MWSLQRVVARILPFALAPLLAACDQAGDREIERSIFRVLTVKPAGSWSTIGRGTAFKVNGTSTVVTNNHVVQDATSIVLVYWNDGRFEEAEARIEYADRNADLAILRTVKAIPGKPLPIARYTPAPTSEAWALGFPGAADALFGRVTSIEDFLLKLSGDPSMSLPTRTFGTISSERQRGRVSYLQHQVPTSPGSSGSPLVDACGSVIGINTLSVTNASSMFGAVSSRELLDLMQLRSIEANIATNRCWVMFEPRYAMYTWIGIAALLMLVVGLLAFVRYVSARGMRSGRQPRLGRTTGPARPSVGKVIDITPIPLHFGPELVERGAEVKQAAPRGPSRCIARLLPMSGGSPLEVQPDQLPGSVTIGRASDCGLVIDHPTISRRHCRLELTPAGELRLHDLGSGNGTRVNGAPVANGTLRSGDRLAIGSLEFKLELNPSDHPRMASPSSPVLWQLSGTDEQKTPVKFVIGGRTTQRSWIIGRASDADLVISSSTVSGKHAALRIDADGRLEIQDLGSSNGTFVKGKRLGREWATIGEADLVNLGGCTLTLTQK